MKVHTKHPKIYLAVFLFAALAFFQTGCQKSGLEEIETAPALEQKFFNGTANLDPGVQRVVTQLRKDNATPGFLKAFVNAYGYPMWDKNFRVAISSNNTAANLEDTKDSSIIIPVFKPENRMVYTYIIATAKDSLVIALRNAGEYAKLPFGDERELVNEAEKEAVRFMMVNNWVFGYTRFNITDKRLFYGSSDYRDTGKVKIEVELAKNENSNLSKNADNSNLDETPFCILVSYTMVYTKMAKTVNGYSLLPGGEITICAPWWGSGLGGGTAGGYSAGTVISTGGDGGSGGWIANDPLANMINQISTDLGLTSAETNWLFAHDDKANSISQFLYELQYSDLTFDDKKALSKHHLQTLITDPEYLTFVDDYKESVLGVPIHPWMIELFKELAIEIGFKVIKKYLPGYSDLNSVKDAIQNASHGDWLGVAGEILNIVKKKVPFTAAIDAIYDIYDFSSAFIKVKKVFSKIQRIPTNAFNSLVSTIKNRCGGLLNKIEYDNDVQSLLRYNPNQALEFFQEFAQNIPGVTMHNPSPGVYYFDLGPIRFSFYPVSNSQLEPTLLISQPGTSWEYKIRFRL